MELNEAQQARVLEKVRSLWTNLVCESCGQESWSIASDLMVMPLYRRRNAQVFVPAVPVVMAFCENCGQIRLYNAVHLGIVDAKTGAVLDG